MKAPGDNREGKRALRFLIALLGFLLFPVAIAGEEGGLSSKAMEVAYVPAGETVDEDYFAFGPKIEISGTINGDVYAFGGDILVDGTVNGDLLTAGGAVTLSGTVAQDVRIAGGRITISGEIGRNMTVAGGDVTLTPSATVEGSIVAAGGNLNFGAPIGSNLTVAGGSVTVSNKVHGNINAAAGSVRISSKAQLDGDLTYWSGKEASIAEGATIAGKVTRRIPPKIVRMSSWEILGILVGLRLLIAAVSFVSTLIIGLLLIRFLPRYHETALSILRERPLACLGSGFLIGVLTPIIVAALLGLLFTIPIALILLAAFVIALYLGRVVSISWCGHAAFRVFGKTIGQSWGFITGLVIYFVLALIPVIGPLFTLFFVLFGVGTDLLARMRMYRAARSQQIV